MPWKDFFRGTTEAGSVSSNLYTDPGKAQAAAQSFTEVANEGSAGVEKQTLFECEDGSLTDSPTLWQRICGK